MEDPRQDPGNNKNIEAPGTADSEFYDNRVPGDKDNEEDRPGDDHFFAAAPSRDRGASGDSPMNSQRSPLSTQRSVSSFTSSGTKPGSALKGSRNRTAGGQEETDNTPKSCLSRARFSDIQEVDMQSVDAAQPVVETFPSGESIIYSSAGDVERSPSTGSLPAQVGHRLGRMMRGFSFQRSASIGSIDSFEKLQMSAETKVKAITCTMGFGGVTWFLTSSVLLFLFGIQYDGPVVDQDQARYATSAAERAAVNAASVLGAGLASRDALDYAIKNKLYFEPLDYAGVRAAVEPVFAGFPSLRAVDIAFAGREDFITVRRLVNDDVAVGSFMSMERAKINVRSQAALAMQSSAADCTTLGERGCLLSANPSGQRWHRLASGLWAGEESDGFRGPSDKVFRWDDRPGFVPRDPARSGAAGSVAWSAAYSLVFRSAFPGTSGKLSVLGRSVMDLSGLRADEQLSDLTLGARGAVYICDRAGTLLAAAEAGDQAFAQTSGGVFRFRRLDELPAKWASKLEPFNGQPQNFYTDGMYVVVQPLIGRGLSNFSAVVAADRNAFVDEGLSPLILGAKLIALLPYPVFIITFVMLQIYRDRGRRQTLRRVHVLHEGMATLHHRSNFLEAGPEVVRSKLKLRNQERLIATQREAQYSMAHFLCNSEFNKPKGDIDTEGRVALQLKDKDG